MVRNKPTSWVQAEAQSAAGPFGVIFDETGAAWPAQSPELAYRLAYIGDRSEIIARAVREHGFVHVMPIRDAVFLTFEPSTVRALAAFAAFYEISAWAPKLLILTCPGEAGQCDRYEVFNNPIEGLRRLEAAVARVGGANAIAGREPPVPGRANQHPIRERRSRKGPTIIFPAAPDPGMAALDPRMAALDPRMDAPAGDYSMRLARPVDSISDEDRWFGQLLQFWGGARGGRRLPSIASLDPLEVLNIARGRAHIVETANSNPGGYRFRLWGAVNSYGEGYANRTLSEMPASLMRDEAIEDYRGAVGSATPSYHLITHVENEQSYSYARLLLPLAQDGRRVDRLIVLINERPLPELGSR